MSNQDYNSQFELLMEQNNGYLRIAQLEAMGIDRYYAYPYIRKEKLKKVARGVYCDADMQPDQCYLVCLRNNKAILSHESAAYVNGLIEAEPGTVSVTVPQGYNTIHLTDKWVTVYQIDRSLYELGSHKKTDPAGNPVTTYDPERTICDLVRQLDYKKHIDEDLAYHAMATYFSNEYPRSMENLLDYSRKMGIKEKVRIFVNAYLSR